MALFIFVIGFILIFSTTLAKLSENDLKNFLENEYEKTASVVCTKVVTASWDYNVDLKNETKEEILLNVKLESAKFTKDNWEKYFKHLNIDDYSDEQLRRQVKILKNLGEAALTTKKLKEYTENVNNMTNIYSTAKICPFNKQKCNLNKEGLSLDPEIDQILAKSRNWDELLYVWKAWRDASGAKIRELYKPYIELSNEVAKANSFDDKGEMWRDDYDTPTLIEDVDRLWKQVEPLYDALHKYVGMKLKEKYQNKIDLNDGLLPAHIFGNMWAQDWSNIADIVRPFPNASKINIDRALLEQNYTVLKMFETADEFYQSLGLIPNGICYDVSKGAMIEKPTDGRDVVCHASAWDFCDGINYRIKMCTKINFEDFLTIHHEMGHIQYFMQYNKHLITLRNGANPGFHEAIGDTISLSVATPKHLQRIGLAKNFNVNEQSDINTLMDMALQKVAFLPFGLLIDKWRWDIFKGDIPEDQWNNHWWKYREQYQKIKAPVSRSKNDFDPAAKYHVAADSQYIAYFVAHILQFQFYKSLCIAANEYDPNNRTIEPLHRCDYYQSKEAGKKLSDGLSLGYSEHWSKVLEKMTGESTLNADALMEYFEPLYKFLLKEISKNNY